MDETPSLEPLPSHLIRRLSPCVHCVVTDAVAGRWGDVEGEIERVWGAVADEGERFFRVVFPGVRGEEWVWERLATVRSVWGAEGSGFFFPTRGHRPGFGGELPTIARLRLLLVEATQLLLGNFFDIPVAVLVFVASPTDEVRLPAAPPWCRAQFDAVPRNAVVFDPARLRETVQSFYDQFVVPRFVQAVDRARQAFLSGGGSDATVSMVRSVERGTPLERSVFVRLKCLADHHLMAGDVRTARSLYLRLLDHTPAACQSLVPGLAFLVSSVDIVLGELTPDSFSRLATPSLLFATMSFWIRSRLGAPDPVDLVPFAAGNRFEVFVREQLLFFGAAHRIPLGLLQCHRAYMEAGLAEHGLRCLWACHQQIEGRGLFAAESFVLETVAGHLLREPTFGVQPTDEGGWFMGAAFGRLLLDRQLARAPIVGTYLAISRPAGLFRCGFVQTTFVRWTRESSARTGPAGFRGDWGAMQSKIFGTGASFFAASDIRDEDVAVGDVVVVRVRIHTDCDAFGIEGVRLHVEGNAVSFVVDAIDESGEAELRLEATGGGRIVVDGVCFVWGECVEGLSVSGQPPIVLECHADDPVVELVSEGEAVEELVAGDSVLRSVVAQVRRGEVGSLSMLVAGDPLVQLVDPCVRTAGGRHFFGAKGAGDEVRMVFRVGTDAVGERGCWVFVVWRGQSGRTAYRAWEVRAAVFPRCPSDGVPDFPAFCADEGTLPPFRAEMERAGQSAFVLRVANPTDHALRNVRMELEGSACTGRTRRCIQELGAGEISELAFAMVWLGRVAIAVSITGKSEEACVFRSEFDAERYAEFKSFCLSRPQERRKTPQTQIRQGKV